MLIPFEEPTEFDFFQNKKTNKIYISRSFSELDSTESARFASKVIDSEGTHKFLKQVGEVILQISNGERYEIKALFYEDSREIKTFTIQKFIRNSGKPFDPEKPNSFTFSGDEIKVLVDFIHSIPNLDLLNPNKIRIDDEILRELILSKEQAANIFNNNRNTFEELFKNEISISDITQLAYKRDQLKYFKKLLKDEKFFESEKADAEAKGDEQVWQNFFEKNTWILGYGLDYIFNTPLEGKKLEQVVTGYNTFGAGKRVDALMKTRGIINSLCFCEIKTHNTQLLKKVKNCYRPEVWAISEELAGGVAQIQKTVQKSIKQIATKTQIKDDEGNLTGEEVFLYNPKSFLVIGSLKEFKGSLGTNEDKFSSFEIFRQNVFNREIITFDELYERAKFIICNEDIVENITLDIPSDIPSNEETFNEDDISFDEDDIPF
ncbi:MAG TPA: DUF4263 domain-containing protein [Pyrinomonadaceae bacterium]|nr:DUF4263 domain-containing protein [Pyrinomonadaceae bacterium]